MTKVNDVAFQSVIIADSDVTIATVEGSISYDCYLELGSVISEAFRWRAGKHLLVDIREATFEDSAFGPGLLASVMQRCRKHDPETRLAFVVSHCDEERMEITKMNQLAAIFLNLDDALNSADSWPQVPPEPMRSKQPFRAAVNRIKCPHCGNVV